MITQTLQLNLVPKGVWPRLYVSQYDAGSRTLTFEIYNGDQRFTLTSGTTAKIQGTKPDRHGFSYDASVDTSNNVITADITQQMTAAHGEAYCELVLFKSGQRIGTLNFVMMIQQAGLNDDTDTSDSDLPDIIAEATEQMFTAEAYAKGTRNGTAVTSGQTGYHDNSKYYKEQAATQASNASTSATSANTNALKAEGYAVGKQNGTTQTSGTYYHNNAQYYKEQAASSATTASTKAGEASSSANTASQKASAASTSAQTASDKALVAEGYAKGTQNGTPVGSTSPYYHNNAEYFKGLANPTVAANVSFNNSGTDMSSTNVQDGIVENRTSIQNLSTVISKNGAKNLLPFSMELLKEINPQGPSYSWSGNVCTTSTDLTITVETDKDGNLLYVDVNGTASVNTSFYLALQSVNIEAGDYLLSGCTGGSQNSYRLYANDNQYIVNHNNFDGDTAFTVTPAVGNFNVRIFVGASTVMNHVKFYPMIRRASDTDPTYEPWAMTNQLLTKETTGLIDNQYATEVVNLAPFEGTTQIVSGVQITFNSDGSITCNGVNTDKKATANIRLQFGAFKVKKGVAYKITNNAGGSVNNIAGRCLVMRQSSDGVWKASTDSNAAPYTYTPSADTNMQIIVAINSGLTVNNITFWPMVSVSTYNGPWVPYGGKSNKELTEDVDTINNNGFLRANSYCISVSASSGDIDKYGRSLGLITSTSFDQLIALLRNGGKYTAFRIMITTNDAMLNSSAPQFLQDLCGIFSITACAQLIFDIKIVDTYYSTSNERVEITVTDKNLSYMKVARITNGTATIKTIALS